MFRFYLAFHVGERVVEIFFGCCFIFSNKKMLNKKLNTKSSCIILDKIFLQTKFVFHFILILLKSMVFIYSNSTAFMARSAGAVEYTDSISAGG